MAKIRSHNADTSKTWKEGVNHMTDWTVEEVCAILLISTLSPPLSLPFFAWV
jgi:hypothetical protein